VNSVIVNFNPLLPQYHFSSFSKKKQRKTNPSFSYSALDLEMISLRIDTK